MNDTNQEISVKELMAFSAMVIGMFMAVLDIQIVASSLSVIAAGLSASGDELSWIQTSYLIAEVIIIPITGFATRLLSTKIVYFIAAAGFTIMSLLCSIAWNIESMILFRAVQGFLGGAMIPTAFASIFIMFPKHMHIKMTMITGLVVTIGPTVGPTLGGYITELFSWHFMFLINIIPGFFVSIAVLICVDFDKPNYKLLKNFDFIGIILMIFALGGLQYLLEEGNKHDWFDSNFILFITIFVTISFIVLLIREMNFINPIINLASFKNKNFTFGCIYSFILGIGLYGTVYLLPLFLFRIAGFTTLQIGTTMAITGLFQFVSAPLAGSMMSSNIDKRIILAIGYILFSLGCYTNSFLTSESHFWEFFIPQMIRGLSLMFCFMPINDLALGSIEKDNMQNASGLYNLTRNLGGAIGLAIITNIITTKSDIYIQAIKDNMPLSATHILYQLSELSRFFGNQSTINNDQVSLILLNDIILREAFIIAINNVFMLISILFATSMILLPFTKPLPNIKKQ